MDQIRIGKFIAESRKSMNLTQRQLADALSISDKTISKWECGKGLPEVSLMLPLCAALDITVNDLLSGEKVSSTDYKKKAEGNRLCFRLRVEAGIKWEDREAIRSTVERRLYPIDRKFKRMIKKMLVYDVTGTPMWMDSPKSYDL